MENVWDRSREEFIDKGGQTRAHPWGPDCYTFFSCKLWDMSALLEPNKESFSCVVLLKKADMAEM